MMPEHKLNLELFERVKQKILAKPESFNMYEVLAIYPKGEFNSNVISTSDLEEVAREPDSLVGEMVEVKLPEDHYFYGTVACIAGWATILASEDPFCISLPNGILEEKTVSLPLLNFRLRRRSDRKGTLTTAMEEAARLLGIDDERYLMQSFYSGEAQPAIFFISRWPQDLYDRFNNEESQVGRAKVAAEAIDRFVADPDEFMAAARKRQEPPFGQRYVRAALRSRRRLHSQNRRQVKAATFNN